MTTPAGGTTGDPTQIERVLTLGRMELIGLMPRASNYTFLARVRHDGTSVRAVYKPRAGEAPLWDFPDGTLCQREVAAYAVSRALGWPAVPPTVLRDGPEGPGSVQLFVEFDPRQHYFTLRASRRADFRRIALFDAVINNADRKGGHCLLGADGVIHVIDHGVCFHEEPKLRTVIWDDAGSPIPDDLCAALSTLGPALRSGPLRAALDLLLSAVEMDALDARVRDLVATGRFPLPGPGYPYPWPPV